MKLLTKIWKNKIFVTLLLMVFIFTPSSIYQQVTNKIRTIVTTMGVDLTESGVGVSILHIIPKSASNFNQNTEIAYAEGKNVAEAISKMSLNLGKYISLAHCDAVLLSKDVAEKGISEYLDYLIRRTNLTTSALLVTCDNSKELMQTIKNSKILTSMSVRELVEYNNRYLFSSDSSVENYELDYFGGSKLSFIPFISLSDQNFTTSSSDESGGGGMSQGQNQQVSSSQSGNESSSNENSGSGAGSGGKDEEKDVLNDGKTYVLNEGKLVFELDKDIIELFNILDLEIKRTILTSEDFLHNDKIKSITVETYDKSIKKEYKFLNGKPIFHLDIRLILTINEVDSDRYTVEDVDNYDEILNETVKNVLLEKIENDFSKAVDKTKESGLDLFLVEKKFNTFHHKEWQEYIKDNSNIFKDMIFSYDIKLVKK